jgi:hypothetical protein
MKNIRSATVFALSCAVLLSVLGCTLGSQGRPLETSRPYYPTSSDLKFAEDIAKSFCWEMMDRTAAGASDAFVKTGPILPWSPDVTEDVPDDFAIEGVPFSHYKVRWHARVREGRREIVREYFNPDTFPDWETTGVRGGFPDFFCLIVDIDRKCMAGIYAERR